MKKAQTVFEFLALIIFIVFIFVIFLFAVNMNVSNKKEEQESTFIKFTAEVIKEEIDLADKSEDGYMRNFTLPVNLNNKDYNLEIIKDVVFINTSTQSIAINIVNLTGEIKKGENNIKKINGTIYLNK